MANFYCSERFDVKGAIERTELPNEINIPIFSEAWMQPTDHMDLCNPQVQCFAHHGDDFINRVLKCMRVSFFCGKRAKLTGENTNVRVINVTVVNICGVVAVL